MACIESTAVGVKELFDAIVRFVTDPSNFTDGNEWKLISPAVLDSATNKVILKGVGKGDEEIFIGLKIEENGSQHDIVLNGYAGIDLNLDWEEQPGAIYHEKLPILPLAKDIFMPYWIAANTRRIIIAVEMSSQIETAYLGLMNPVGIQNQDAYPLVIAGTYIQGGKWPSKSPGHSAFVNPGSDVYGGGGTAVSVPIETANTNTSAFRLRRPDGTWVTALNVNNAGTSLGFERLNIWPCNTKPTETYTVFRKTDDLSKLEDNMLYPVKLYESHPAGNVGILDGVYFISNRVDIASKDTIIYKDRPYKVFCNVTRRDDDSYFAVEWG